MALFEKVGKAGVGLMRGGLWGLSQARKYFNQHILKTRGKTHWQAGLTSIYKHGNGTEQKAVNMA